MCPCLIVPIVILVTVVYLPFYLARKVLDANTSPGNPTNPNNRLKLVRSKKGMGTLEEVKANSDQRT